MSVYKNKSDKEGAIFNIDYWMRALDSDDIVTDSLKRNVVFNAVKRYLSEYRDLLHYEIEHDDDVITIDIEHYNNALDLYAHNENRIKKNIKNGIDPGRIIDVGRGMELIFDALGIDYYPIENEVWGDDCNE